MSYKVPYIDLPSQYRHLEKDISPELHRVFSTGSFILRDDVRQLEEKLASYIGVSHVVGVNSGTDALFLALYSAGLKKGDEVITVSHTFVATIAVIVHCGLKPVLVDVNDDFNMDIDHLKKKITSKTKAIIPVHMNGRMCDMEKITAIAKKQNLIVIEDAAQSLGSSLNGKMAGAWGWAGCFSLHPMKNLGGGGDGGFIATNDSLLAENVRLLRNHGQTTKEDIRTFGFNSRLDNLQAAILKIKLNYLPRWIKRRREIANFYDTELKGLSWIKRPPFSNGGAYFDVYSSYVVRTQARDLLMQHLKKQGIEVFAHWPRPNHLQKGLKLNQFHLPNTETISHEVCSLPVYAEMTDQQVEQVIDSLKRFQNVH